MALLTRYFELNDAGDTRVFNFIVTKSVTRDVSREVISKDFVCGFHRWAISFSREEKTLGVYLVWRSPSDGVNVSLDMSVTLVNREHFSENRSFSLKRAAYRSGYHSNGNGAFIKIADLLTHRPRFIDTNGEFLIELRISGAETFFEKDLFFPRSVGEYLKGPRGTADATADIRDNVKVSNEFAYGPFLWTVTVRPQLLLTWRQDEIGIGVFMTRRFRANSQSLICRLAYAMSAGPAGEGRVSMEKPRDEMVGTHESTTVWSPRATLQDCVVKNIRDGGMVRIRVDLEAAHALSEFVLCASPSSPGGGADEDDHGVNGDDSLSSGLHSVLRRHHTMRRESSHDHPASSTVLGLDSEGCNWSMESDLHSGFLRFSFAFLDINKIPRNHLRFVQWRSFLVRRSKRWRGHRDEREQIELVDFQSGNLFAKYYAHDDSDQGIMMETTLSRKEIKDGLSEFLEEGNLLRVRIQWDFSHQLFQSTVNQNDEVAHHHNLQMRDEIESLREKIRGLELTLLRQQQQQQHDHGSRLHSTDSQESNASMSSVSNDPFETNGNCPHALVAPPTPGGLAARSPSPRLAPLTLPQRTRGGAGAGGGGCNARRGMALRRHHTVHHQRYSTSSVSEATTAGNAPTAVTAAGRRQLRLEARLSAPPPNRAHSAEDTTATSPYHSSAPSTASVATTACSGGGAEADDEEEDGGGGCSNHSNNNVHSHRFLWSSPVVLRRVIAPLRQSLSVSSDKSPLATVHKMFHQGQKCQSMD